MRGVAVLIVAATLAVAAAPRARSAAGPVDRTVSCTTTAVGTFHVEFAPYTRKGWFSVSAGLGNALVEVGSGRGFHVDSARCRATRARVALTRSGIRGRWLVYESQPYCRVGGRVVVHVRGRVLRDNRFTGRVAVRTTGGFRVAYATFDRNGTAKAYVAKRCTA